MSEYDQNNRGAIWANTKKEKDTHPDFTGSLNVDGKEYWVSAWKRKPDASDKSPALSFSVKAKIEPLHKPDPISTGRHPNGYSGRDLDDDVPF